MSFLSNLKLRIYQFKIHTRWKGLVVELGLGILKLITVKNKYYIVLLFPILITLLFLSEVVLAGPAKVVLYQGLKKLEISSRQCRSGIYMKNSTTFTCACVTGVWGFYHDYCSKPISIVGGDSYCFRMKNHSISQVVSFGSLKFPFEASISIFRRGFFLMTESHTDDNSTLSDPTSSFLTITDTSWTIFSETGDSLCLKSTLTGKRKFCLFGDEINKNPLSKWNSITKVKKGCLSKNIRRADSCSDILPPNDYADCSLDLLDELVTEPSNALSTNDNDTDTDESPNWIPIKRVNVESLEESLKLIPIKSIDISAETEDDPGWIPIKRIDTSAESDDDPGWIPIKRIDTSAESDDDPGWIPIKRITASGNDTDDNSEWIPIKRVNIPDDKTEENPEWIPIKRVNIPDDPSDENPEWIPIKEIQTSNEFDEDHFEDSTDTSEETTPRPGWIKIRTKIDLPVPTPESSSESSEQWIPIYRFTTSTTEEPDISSTTEFVDEEQSTTLKPVDICDMGLSRDKVKDYWLDPANNECSKSINEAVFTDQLRRFTVKQFDKTFSSRLKSLVQMEEMLNYTKQIMQKICGEDYVPAEFLEVAFSAFMMFVKEDFFYGVEGVTPDVYPRILKTLRKCLDKAEPFIFETDSLECGMKKINGWFIQPGKRSKLEVPIKSNSENFEPLIETMWKMFLNTHSLCFPDFQFSNDHHHFSVLIMELFSKSIYEKWSVYDMMGFYFGKFSRIEPLDSRELYSFILPNYNFLKETMENIDYCVAATNEISTCPAWMSRSGVTTPNRKKRSIWVDKVSEDKKRSEIWDGEAFCLQQTEDPEHRLGLGLPECDSST